MNPLVATVDVFDESVLKVEFLPLPSQVPDFAFNLNTEAAYMRFANLMNGLVGPMRVSGCACAFDFNNITIQPGLMAMGPFLVRVASTVTLSADSSQMVYAHCSIVRYTSDNHPEIVNINPPLAPSALPGPNQYRSTVEFILDDAGELPANTSTDFYYKIAELDVNGRLVYQLYLNDVKLGAIDFASMLKDTISQHGTTAPEFRVGVDSLNGGLGFKVVLEADASPMVPKNLRVTSIVPASASSPYRQPSMTEDLPLLVQGGVVSHDAVVALEWNWKDIVGTGGNGVFTVTNAYTWSANELADYYLYIPQLSQNFKIISNLATSGGHTVLTVHNEAGVSVSLTGVTVSSIPAVIHCNVDAYEVVAIPYLSNGTTLDANGRVESQVAYGESPVMPQRNIVLTLGQRVVIKVRSVIGSAKSAWVVLAPLDVKYTYLTADGMLSASPLPSGFRLGIAGWANASSFEIVYAQSPRSPDFASQQQNHLVTSSRLVDISVPGNALWNVKVRPLLGGQAVGVALSIPARSGVKSSTGNEIPIAQFRVHLRSYTAQYSGTTVFNRPITDTFAFENVKDTFGAIMQDIPTEFIGRLMVDPAGAEFILSEKRNQLAFDLIDADGLGRAPATADGSGISNGTIVADRVYRVAGFTSVTYNGVVYGTNQSFIGLTGVPSWAAEVGSGTIQKVAVINGTRRARNVYRSDYFTEDYRLTRVSVRADVVVGAPTLVWYQGATPAQKGVFAIPQVNGAQSYQDTDVVISQSAGARSLVVDLWDPAPSNQSAPQLNGFTGMVTIYAIPIGDSEATGS